VKVAVAMVTYRRALPYLLTSVASQTRKPEDVVMVLKLWGDGSEEVIKSFSSQLPIKLVVQERESFTDAVQMAIDNARGDVILFLDDAVAEERWVEKYENLTPCPTSAESVEQHIKHVSRAVKLSKPMSPSTMKNYQKIRFYRRPPPDYVNQHGWIARSGFMGAKAPPGDVYLSALLGGVNGAVERRSEGLPACLPLQ